MPYPIDERMNSVREMYRSAVNRSIDFVTAPNTASDAVEAYQGLLDKYQTEIDTMMRDATFTEKCVQILAASAGSYLVYSAGKKETAAEFSLNPAKLITNVLSNVFTSVLAAPKEALSLAMAASTYEIIYDQMNTAGRAHEYQTELQTNIAKAAYAANVKASFDNLADTMLRAFCLREIQLQGTTDDAKRKQINDNYLAYLVSLVNTHVKTMYEHHQDDIDADATRWWLWKKICSVFENQDDRQRHTQAMQMGLLHLVSGFHKGLAEEKTWIGKNPLKFAVYSGLAGIAVGVLATFLGLPVTFMQRKRPINAVLTNEKRIKHLKPLLMRVKRR